MAKINLAPAFQTYAADWLADTLNALLTPAEEGARFRLKCHAWRDPDCSLPDDDEELAMLSRLGDSWHKGSGEKLRKCFIPHPKKPGRLCDMGLMEERKKQEAWRKKSQEGGKRSAESRALRSKERSRLVEGSLTNGGELVEPNGNSSSSSSFASSSSSSSSSSIPKEEREERKTKEKSSAAPDAGERSLVEVAAGRTVSTWEAYSAAYRNRYGINPHRDKQVNGILAKLVERLGPEIAPHVAAFYVEHNKSFYVSNRHPVEALLKDCTGLKTQWQTGVKATTGEARNAERRDDVMEQVKRVTAMVQPQGGA
ncbi:MAG: hypothetical protein HRU82_03440 [Nitrospira sp.]|nr:MAG: hypothetical protein HRU82_03440 [Nitrospira sp.]